MEKKSTAKKQPTPENGAIGFIKAKKKLFITAGALLTAVVILLLILNPANSPKAVFDSYLSCLHSRNADRFTAISYEANFSKTMASEAVAESYKGRFSSADDNYKNGGQVDLLKGADIRITEIKSLTQSEISTRRSYLKENYRNTERITDIRSISFEMTRDDIPSIGKAELICVTGKWYIGDVSDI